MSVVSQSNSDFAGDGVGGGYSAVSAASGTSVAARRAAQRERARVAYLNIDRDYGAQESGAAPAPSVNAGMFPPAQDRSSPQYGGMDLDKPVVAVDMTRRSAAAIARRPVQSQPAPVPQMDFQKASCTSLGDVDAIIQADKMYSASQGAPPVDVPLTAPSTGRTTARTLPADHGGIDSAEMVKLRREVDQLRLDKQHLEDHNQRYDALVRDREEKLRMERDKRRQERADARRQMLSNEGSALSEMSQYQSQQDRYGDSYEPSTRRESFRNAPTRRTRDVRSSGPSSASASEVGRLRQRARDAEDLERRLERLERELAEQKQKSQCACVIA